LKRIASRRHNNAKAESEAGFTLTELVAGLLVASMLIVGLADITRRYALTTVRVKDATADIRTARAVKGLMNELERIDPDSLTLSADRLTARAGSAEITVRLTPGQNGARRLEWSSPLISRTILLPAAARFALTPSGTITLLSAPGEPPLAIVTPVRTISFNCRFDTATRECR
jgi:hypothetical protein